MHKPISLLLSFVLCFHQLAAQRHSTEDVVHLSNGWVIRGAILQRSDSSVRIQTRDGSEFVFKTSEVQAVSRESAWEERVSKRWLSAVELGPLIAGKTTQNGVTTAAFSLQMSAAYRWKSWLATGAGIGADLYATQTLVPVFATIRGDFWPTRAATWFYFLDGGYSQNITQQSQTNSGFRGGGTYAAGIGWRIPFSPAAGFLLSIGYRFQHTSYDQLNGRVTEDYRRIALRAGFYL